MTRSYPKGVDAERMNAAREQQVLNARLACLAAVAQVHQGKGTGVSVIEAETSHLAEWLIGDIDALKPKSSLVVTSVMPPPAAGFKPGD